MSARTVHRVVSSVGRGCDRLYYPLMLTSIVLNFLDYQATGAVLLSLGLFGFGYRVGREDRS